MKGKQLPKNKTTSYVSIIKTRKQTIQNSQPGITQHSIATSTDITLNQNLELEL